LDTRQLLDQLRQERAELDATIRVLERHTGSTPARAASAAKPKRHGRVMSAAAKAAMSRKLKAIWAAKKKASAARSKAAKARVKKAAA
jgi:hypothetical protein